MTLEKLAGWGRALCSTSDVTAPISMEALRQAMLSAGPAGTIAHAAARSYGDPALNANGAAIRTTSLDRILAFDPQTGAIEAEPGLTFATLAETFLPQNFLAPVTPGTSFATIGGAVAMDVHGKNHEHAGSFGQHVTELDLLTPDGTLRTITPNRDKALFRATCGGIGLTGIVTRIAFRMQKIPGPAMEVTETRAESLAAFLAAMEDAATAPYSVGWIDGTASGGNLGRGILETARHIPGNAPYAAKNRRIPFDFPAIALNPLTVTAFNTLYYHRIPKSGRTRTTHVRNFLYPLDSIQNWNRIYGRRGFHQFQAVIPQSSAEPALKTLLETIAATRRASFLAVLKRMGPGRAGNLSFPMQGYTLALDFPATSDIAPLYANLVAITRNFGGRVYLAKDALMNAGDLAAMYPELPAFRATLHAIDPEKRMRSDMRARLGI